MQARSGATQKSGQVIGAMPVPELRHPLLDLSELDHVRGGKSATLLTTGIEKSNEVTGYAKIVEPARKPAPEMPRYCSRLPDPHALVGRQIQRLSRLHIERRVPGVDVAHRI